MKIFDSVATQQALPFDKLIAALQEMFEQGCQVPRRHNHAIKVPDDKSGTLLIMPAWQEGKYLGIKHVMVYPFNSAQGLPGLHSTYTLFDGGNGVPLACIDGDAITSRRTAAASALAAKYLARKNSRRLLIVGAGKVARELAPAYAAVHDITEVAVWNIQHRNAELMAASLREQGFDARAIASLEEGVRWADIVSCATFSQAPLILREWLQPGVHLDLIGSFAPDMRESDDATFADTSVFVDTEEALDKAGDLLSPMAAGVFTRDRVRATLEELCRGKCPGRQSDEEITVYKCVGYASEDLAAAMLVYEQGVQPEPGQAAACALS